MKLLSLASIRKNIKDLAQKIKAPNDSLPTFGSTRDFGHPHVEVDKKGYHYVVIERGIEHKRKTTQDLDELIYWAFSAITFQMASDYELHHRVPNQDFRRLLFEKQLELMKTINLNFYEKLKKEKDAILKEYPFDDSNE